MKKTFRKVLGFAVLVTLLVGCAPSNETKEVVTTDGSTSMEKVIGGLGEYFTEKEGITVTYNPTGSGAGIKAVQEGRSDIGLSSRNLKDSEKGAGLKGTILAYDGIALVVNKSNTVSDISQEDIAKIYKGEITNWNQVGGADQEIVLIGREAGSGTRDGFESILKIEDKAKYRQELTSTGDVITTVSNTPGAVGYASLASLKDSIKTLKVNGIQPTEENIKNGKYVVQRPFVLVTKADKELGASAKKFFAYVTSKEAAEVISQAGVVSPH